MTATDTRRRVESAPLVDSKLNDIDNSVINFNLIKQVNDMSLKYKNVKNMDELNAVIEAAIHSAKTMRNKVQVAAVAILMHAEKHGDYSKAQYLVEQMNEHGVKATALVEWFVKFGGLQVDEETSSFTGWEGADYVRANFQDAKAKMWWEFKKSNPFKGFCLDAELKRVLDKANATRTKVAGMSDEDQAKVDLDISGATAAALLALLAPPVVVEDEKEEAA